MKKLFKKGLIALTLIAGMTFAAPQNASAGYSLNHTKNTMHYHFWGNDVYQYGLTITDMFIFLNDDGTIDGLTIFSDGTWSWSYNI